MTFPLYPPSRRLAVKQHKSGPGKETGDPSDALGTVRVDWGGDALEEDFKNSQTVTYIHHGGN